MIKLTKCNGNMCVLKNQCERYTDKIEDKAISAPFKIKNGVFHCQMFLKNENNIIAQIINIGNNEKIKKPK